MGNISKTNRVVGADFNHGYDERQVEPQVSKRAFAMYKGHCIEGKVVGEYYDWVDIYPDNSNASMDAACWTFKRKDVTFI